MKHETLFNHYRPLIPTANTIEPNFADPKFWAELGALVLNSQKGTAGGDLDFTEKEYSYLSDELDWYEVAFLRNEPDGDEQQRVFDSGETATAEDVINTFSHRLEMILGDLLGIEVAPEAFFKPTSIIGRKYQPSDNSWMVNLTSCGDYPYKNERDNLAGNQIGAEPKECTVLSEPFECTTRFDGKFKQRVFVIAQCEGETFSVLYSENNLID